MTYCSFNKVLTAKTTIFMLDCVFILNCDELSKRLEMQILFKLIRFNSSAVTCFRLVESLSVLKMTICVCSNDKLNRLERELEACNKIILIVSNLINIFKDFNVSKTFIKILNLFFIVSFFFFVTFTIVKLSLLFLSPSLT